MSKSLFHALIRTTCTKSGNLFNVKVCLEYGKVDNRSLKSVKDTFYFNVPWNPSCKKSSSRWDRIWDVLYCSTFKTSRKVVLDNPPVCVCLSVGLSVLPLPFARTLTGVRVNRSSWNFRGIFGYIGRCVASIFEAIRLSVYKIIQ